MQPVQLFVDESRPHKGPYYIVAATVAVGQLNSARRDLRQLLKPGQKQLHFKQENRSRRKKLVTEIGRLSIQSRIYICNHKSDVIARETIFDRLIPDLSTIKANRLIIEAREGQDDRDKLQITRLRNQTNQNFTFDHSPARSEPLLWVPDAIAWCYGNKEKQWRRTLESLDLIAEVIKVAPNP